MFFVQIDNVSISCGCFPYFDWFNIYTIIPHPELKGDVVFRWNPRPTCQGFIWHLSKWYYHHRTKTYRGLLGDVIE